MSLHLWFREEEEDCFEPRKEGFKDGQDPANPYILFFLVQK